MERSNSLIDELELLKARVKRLEEEIAQFREEQKNKKHPVEALLGQHGLPVLTHGDQSRILLPPSASPSDRHHFYRLMRRYSFRLFLRDLINYPEGTDLTILTRYCSTKTVRSYLDTLSKLGIVSWDRTGNYRLIPHHITSFGPTLEWYVAEIFEREFLAPALHGVRLRQTECGGDYDVIGLMRGFLTYVEVKSSPPRGVEFPAISAFLERIRDLRPQVAVFLVDTELRMKDKMVPLFAEGLGRYGKNTRKYQVDRLVDELFHIHHAIYVINSRKGIYSNLRICFRDHLRWGADSGWVIGEF